VTTVDKCFKSGLMRHGFQITPTHNRALSNVWVLYKFTFWLTGWFC